jgi:glycosyltransferase involved in cell wall biosynthesis
MTLTSIILPTTGRKDRAVTCIQGLIATTKDRDVEIIAVVDADPESRDAISKALHGVKHRLLYSDTLRGCSKAWNDGLAVAAGEYIVIAGDDLRWGDGWLDEAIKVMLTLGPKGGCVGLNDGHWNGAVEVATHYMLSRDFIITVLGGVVAWEFYKHSYNDLEITERARAAGRYAWAEQAKVIHEHWLFGGREKDATDNLWLGQHGEATKIYEERKAAGFPCDYVPVIFPAGKTRIGWIVDDKGEYIGGAEMVAAELAKAAPEWAAIVPCPPGQISADVDLYVIHNSYWYGAESIPDAGDKASGQICLRYFAAR